MAKMTNNLFDTTDKDRAKLLEAQVMGFYKILEDRFLYPEKEDNVMTLFSVMAKYREIFNIHTSKFVK